MGYKYDDDNKEWVTTEEWNDRERDKGEIAIKLIVGSIAVCLVGFIAILPARILKWMCGYDFLPDRLSFWQIAGDLCISSPLFLGIIVWILLSFAKSSTDEKGK